MIDNLGCSMKLAVIFAITILMCSPIRAEEDLHSANAMVPMCKDSSNRSAAAFGSGVCIGTVETLAAVSGELSIARRSCAPKGATIEQFMRVAVSYIEARPNRMHESFKTLALEAFKKAWPCPR